MAVPNAVVSRSERARRAGWNDSISIRSRDGQCSVLHRLAKGRVRVAARHIDGKASGVWVIQNREGYVKAGSFPLLDALIRCERPARHPDRCDCC